MQCAFRAKDNESVFMQCAKVFSVQWLPRFGGFPQHPPEAPTLPYPIIHTTTLPYPVSTLSYYFTLLSTLPYLGIFVYHTTISS